MKKKILLPVLLLFGLISFSQKSSQMYAITSSDNNLQWFNIRLVDVAKGNYTIQVLDLTGKILLNKIVNINGSAQFIEVEMRPVFAKGLYMVKVLSHQKKTVYSSKLMLQ